MGNQAIYREIQRGPRPEGVGNKASYSDMAKAGAKWVIKRYIVPAWDAGAGSVLRYPGGTEYASILRTVSRCRPNVRAASRMLIPSTITALRTRRYTSTLYIRRTIHGVGYNPMNDGRRYSIKSPILSNLPPTRPTLTPPFTTHDGGRSRPPATLAFTPPLCGVGFFVVSGWRMIHLTPKLKKTEERKGK